MNSVCGLQRCLVLDLVKDSPGNKVCVEGLVSCLFTNLR